MQHKRKSGVLLHITSLPGEWGMGELGPEARAFGDYLASAGQSLWQILPVNPIGYGFSAYSSSKYALRGFSQALRRELAETGISVSYIAPRAVRTAINSQAVYAMAAADPQCQGGVRVLSQPIYRIEARANAKQREKRHIKTNWLRSERLSNGKSWLYG